MTLAPIIALLTEKIGLDPASVGVDTIARAVRRRMTACGVEQAGAYAERLQASPEEWQLLIDEAVVPETWFFRDEKPFAHLQQYVLSQWLPAHPGSVFRALSVPSASGEEPYSIAMALVDAGLSPGAFAIDAVDVSRKALGKAQTAEYSAASFRGANLKYRDRHFTPIDGGYRLASRIARLVSFRQGNLLDASFAAGQGPYDVIFCRNLLIYFDQAARQRAAQTLARLLREDGLLFAGHAETMYTVGPLFVPLGQARAFAYRKASVEKARESSDQLRASPRPAASIAPTPAPAAKRAAGKPSAEPSRNVLAKASRLADEGRLDVAAALCQELIGERQACEECYCLLGLIQEGLRNPRQAELHYNQALDVNPDHYESLVHLALLVEARGEADRARALRERLRQLSPQSPGKTE